MWVWMSITGMVLVSCGCLAGSAARARRHPRTVIHGRCRQRALGRSGRAPYTGRGTQEAHMGTTSTIGWIVLAAAAVAVIVIYNRLVRWRNAVANAFAQIDVQLKRRYDLIPNLVKVARKYLQHERETLEAVTAARNQAFAAADIARRNPVGAEGMAALGAAEQHLGGALGRLMAVAEAYPELKADRTMRELSEELTSTENRVGFA